jgi:hypothetical protein
MYLNKKTIDFMDEEEFIKLPNIPKEWKENELTEKQYNYINRGTTDSEPVELQLHN